MKKVSPSVHIPEGLSLEVMAPTFASLALVLGLAIGGTVRGRVTQVETSRRNLAATGKRVQSLADEFQAAVRELHAWGQSGNPNFGDVSQLPAIVDELNGLHNTLDRALTAAEEIRDGLASISGEAAKLLPYLPREHAQNLRAALRGVENGKKPIFDVLEQGAKYAGDLEDLRSQAIDMLADYVALTALSEPPRARPGKGRLVGMLAQAGDRIRKAGGRIDQNFDKPKSER